MAVILLLYKPVVTALRKARLAPESRKTTTDGTAVVLNGSPVDAREKKRLNVGFLLFALALLATFVLLTLVLMGIL